MAHGPDTEALMRRVNRATTNLDVTYMDITSLPQLPRTLKTIHCYGTNITSLPPLPAGLKKLFCSYTQITSLPQLPAGLEVLECSDTPLTSLPELPAGLQKLDCSKNRLTSLPELPAGLKELKCYDTQIRILPELPEGLEVLYVWDTPLILKQNEGESIQDYNIRWREWKKVNQDITKRGEDLASVQIVTRDQGFRQFPEALSSDIMSQYITGTRKVPSLQDQRNLLEREQRVRLQEMRSRNGPGVGGRKRRTRRHKRRSRKQKL